MSDLYSERWAGWSLPRLLFSYPHRLRGQYVLMVGFVSSLVFLEVRSTSPCAAQSHPSAHVVLGILLWRPSSSVATDTKTGLSSGSRRGLVGSLSPFAQVCEGASLQEGGEGGILSFLHARWDQRGEDFVVDVDAE